MPHIISITSLLTIKKTALINFLEEIDEFLASKLPDLYNECSNKLTISKLVLSLKEIEKNRFVYAKCVEGFAKEFRNRTKVRASLLGDRAEARKNRIWIGVWPTFKEHILDFGQEELLLVAEKLMEEAWYHLCEFYVEADCLEIDRNLRKYKKNYSNQDRVAQA